MYTKAGGSDKHTLSDGLQDAVVLLALKMFIGYVWLNEICLQDEVRCAKSLELLDACVGLDSRLESTWAREIADARTSQQRL